MDWRTETLLPKKLVGKKLTMSLINNKTPDLWKSFMPYRKDIQHKTDSNLFSLQVYDEAYFKNFNPATVFEKWAAVEVNDDKTIPDEMETFLLTGGLYVVFNYKGDATTAPEAFRYIFTSWLPASAYALDNRPHFEILGEKYKNNDSDSEEEIWIPVKLK